LPALAQQLAVLMMLWVVLRVVLQETALGQPIQSGVEVEAVVVLVLAQVH
jgi:hypothetical protein